MELTGNVSAPKILVIGCFHGDEPQGKYLIEEYLKEFPDTKLAMIPCLNEYGVQNNVRTNSNGVDLNRNFPTNNWILSEDRDYFGGNEPASEVETRFMVEILEEYKPKFILTLHSPYCVVNYDGDALEYAEEISKIIGYPVQSDIGYPTPGSFGTYCGIEREIPTITLELDETVDVKTLVKPVHKIFDYINSMI